MKRRYSLNAKINALNQIDQFDGDFAYVSKQLAIPASTLEKWRANEAQLRQVYQDRQWRYLDRLRFGLHVQMLERAECIVQRINTAAIDNAPLNQLNDALATLLAHVNKFEETQQEIEQPHETIKRAEFYFDGQIHDTPPWAGASAGQSRPLQSGGLRPPLGQDRTRQNDHPAPSLDGEQTLLVADSDPPNGEPSLARFEKFYRALEEHPNKRD